MCLNKGYLESNVGGCTNTNKLCKLHQFINTVHDGKKLKNNETIFLHVLVTHTKGRIKTFVHRKSTFMNLYLV